MVLANPKLWEYETAKLAWACCEGFCLFSSSFVIAVFIDTSFLSNLIVAFHLAFLLQKISLW
jgi:F0F1-type ATP synthase membrane subunit c/vacuolar-type H+-ATPase subunit K